MVVPSGRGRGCKGWAWWQAQLVEGNGSRVLGARVYARSARLYTITVCLHAMTVRLYAEAVCRESALKIRWLPPRFQGTTRAKVEPPPSLGSDQVGLIQDSGWISSSIRCAATARMRVPKEKVVEPACTTSRLVRPRSSMAERMAGVNLGVTV